LAHSESNAPNFMSLRSELFESSQLTETYTLFKFSILGCMCALFDYIIIIISLIRCIIVWVELIVQNMYMYVTWATLAVVKRFLGHVSFYYYD